MFWAYPNLLQKICLLVSFFGPNLGFFYRKFPWNMSKSDISNLIKKISNFIFLKSLLQNNLYEFIFLNQIGMNGCTLIKTYKTILGCFKKCSTICQASISPHIPMMNFFEELVYGRFCIKFFMVVFGQLILHNFVYGCHWIIDFA